jgi:hypothetical protein
MVTVAALTTERRRTERRRTGGREKGREWREGGEATIKRSSPDTDFQIGEAWYWEAWYCSCTIFSVD